MGCFAVYSGLESSKREEYPVFRQGIVWLMMASSPVSEPDPEHIMAAVFARLDLDAYRQIHGASWTKHRTDEDISNGADRSTGKRREAFAVWGDGLRMMQRKTQRDGEPVDEKAERLPFFLEPDLLSRFTFSLAKPAQVRCGDRRTCWYLKFAPKPGMLPASSEMEEQLLGKSSGTILVDTEHFGIVRADARTSAPHRSFKVSVDWFVVSMTQQMTDGTMGPSRIEMTF